jgi:hypothetical protein
MHQTEASHDHLGGRKNLPVSRRCPLRQSRVSASQLSRLRRLDVARLCDCYVAGGAEHRIVNSEPVWICSQPPPECVPAVPLGKHPVALEFVSSSPMLRLRLPADPADLQGRQNHTAQDAIRIGCVARAIWEDRVSCWIALTLAMFCELRGQLADDWNRSLGRLAPRTTRNAVPDRTSN